MSNVPLRGPASGGQLTDMGLPEIFRNGKQTKAERARMREAAKTSAQTHGDTIGAMNKHRYKAAVRSAIFAAQNAERKRRKEIGMNSLDPVKAARVQAMRDAWARVKEVQG